MIDKPDIDERLAQLDKEWQHKYKELDDAWRRYLNNFAEETHREIAKIVGEAVATVVRDIETANKVARAAGQALHGSGRSTICERHAASTCAPRGQFRDRQGQS